VSLERDTPVTLGVTGPGMSAAEARERVANGRKPSTARSISLTNSPTPVLPIQARSTMTMEFTDRVSRVEPSATLAISALATELEADGADVVDLSVGEPDFPTPENIVEAGKDAMDAGHTGYTTSAGILELREAIADKLADDGLDHSTDEIIVTPARSRHCTKSSRRSSERATKSPCSTPRGYPTRPW